MTQDLYLVIGIVLIGLALPALLGALADRRRPWLHLLVLIAGAGLVALAIGDNPENLDLRRVPHAFVRVLAWLRGLVT
ncbi:MAG: hypothetical protein D6811_11375 [Alphaproteobacteria bacterium]|nr:MAG: hypothetical protein D6811_11375 [Alphaproteobacteria bacterium]